MELSATAHCVALLLSFRRQHIFTVALFALGAIVSSHDCNSAARHSAGTPRRGCRWACHIGMMGSSVQQRSTCCTARVCVTEQPLRCAIHPSLRCTLSDVATGLICACSAGVRRLHVACCMLRAARCMLHATWCDFHLACSRLRCICCTLHILCCILHVWFMLHVACCMSHVTYCRVRVAGCGLRVPGACARGVLRQLGDRLRGHAQSPERARRLRRRAAL
jgi:hypothetical protein